MQRLSTLSILIHRPRQQRLEDRERGLGTRPNPQQDRSRSRMRTYAGDGHSKQNWPDLGGPFPQASVQKRSHRHLGCSYRCRSLQQAGAQLEN